MAMIKCSKCNAEYDNELDKVCPVCGEADEAEEITQIEDAAVEETTEETVEDAIEEVVEDDAEEITEDALSEAEDESAQDIEAVMGEFGEDSQADEPKGNNGLKSAVISLAAILVVALATFGIVKYLNNPENRYHVLSKTMNAKKFGIEDVEGKFVDDASKMYYEFKIEEKEIDVPVEPETDPITDSAADSAAEPEFEKVKFDGSYKRGFDESVIKEIVYESYIYENELAQQYDAYKTENNLLKEDFEGFVKVNALEEKVKAYDEEKGVTTQYQEMLESSTSEGFWKFDSGMIRIYDENGEELTSLVITDSGLADILYKGKPKRGLSYQAEFVTEDQLEGVKEKICIYEDGRAFVELDYQGQNQSLNGTYKISGDMMSIEINGQANVFYITNSGLTSRIFVK